MFYPYKNHLKLRLGGRITYLGLFAATDHGRAACLSYRCERERAAAGLTAESGEAGGNARASFLERLAENSDTPAFWKDPVAWAAAVRRKGAIFSE